MEKYISYIRTYHENEAHEQLVNGVQLFQKGQYRQALDAYFTALIVLRDNPDLYNSIGIVYHATGEYTKALDYYKKATAINPQHSNAWHCMGKIYNELHNFPEAIEAFKTALEYDPNNYMSYIYLSISYGGIGNDAEASKMLEELVHLYPDNPPEDLPANPVAKRFPGNIDFRSELDKAVQSIREALERKAAEENATNDAPEQSDKDIHWDDII